MKALVYHGSKDVRVESVADPGLHFAQDEARGGVRGYEIFNDKEEDCRKVVLTP